MRISEAIEKAGGSGAIIKACASRGIDVSHQRVYNWKVRDQLPNTEWTGDTSIAPIICDLVLAVSNIDITPLDLCPGAGQYMAEAREAA